MFEAEGVEALSTSQVHNLDGVEVGHHDVVRLEVQVEDAAVVEVLDSLEDLDQVTHHVVLRVTEPFVSKKKVLKWSNPQTGKVSLEPLTQESFFDHIDLPSLSVEDQSEMNAPLDVGDFATIYSIFLSIRLKPPA